MHKSGTESVLRLILPLFAAIIMFMMPSYGATWLPTSSTETNVKYIDADGKEQTCASATVVSSSTSMSVTWSAGWYVVNDNVTISSSRIQCNGAVNLILADGCTLTASSGIMVSSGNSLTIYGQSSGTGKLVATGKKSGYAYYSGIGSNNASESGAITINGGVVEATGAANAAGIGGGYYNGTGGGAGAGKNIRINRGQVIATGGSGAAGIGGGKGDAASDGVYASKSLKVKAGDSANPTAQIAHGDDDDLIDSAAFKGKQYVVIEPLLYVTYTATILGEAKWSELVWSPEIPAEGLGKDDELEVTASGNASLVFDNDCVITNMLTITGDCTVQASTNWFGDGCWKKTIATDVTGNSLTFGTDFPTGFFGAIELTNGKLTVRGQNMEVISINFAGGNGKNLPVSGTDYTGLAPVQGNTWMNLNEYWLGASTKTLPAFVATADGSTTIDYSDKVTGTCTAQNTWEFTTGVTDEFLKGYLDDGNGSGLTVSLSGIPYDSYDLIVYEVADTTDKKLRPVTVNGVQYTYDSTAPEQAAIGTDEWGVGGCTSAAYGNNAIRICGITGSHLELSIVDGGSDLSARGALAAIQIVCMSSGPSYEATVSSTSKWSELVWVPEKPAGGFQPGQKLHVTVEEGGVLRFDNETTIANPLTVEGTGTIVAGDESWCQGDVVNRPIAADFSCSGVAMTPVVASGYEGRLNEIEGALVWQARNDILDLGSFNLKSMRFTHATGSGTNLFRQLTIMLSRRMSGETIELPTVAGFTHNTELSTDYSCVIDIAEPGRTAGDIAGYIREVVFRGCRDQVLRFILAREPASYRSFFFDNTRHFYQYVPVAPVTNDNYVCGGISWTDAYEAARSMTFMGRRGYLATIVSHEEDMFVYEASNGRVGWLGGTSTKHGARDGLYYDSFDPMTNDTTIGYWYWACGPELGRPFFDGTSRTTPVTEADYLRNIVTNGYYSNWDSSNAEPSGTDQSTFGGFEGFLTTLGFGNGYCTRAELPDKYGWNDLINSYKSVDTWGHYAPLGYIVEFGDRLVGDGCENNYVNGYIDVEVTIRAPIVTYDAGDGAFPGGDKTNAVAILDAYSGYVLPDSRPALDGYHLAGWYGNPEDESTAVTTGSPLLTRADHTLYAKWAEGGYSNMVVQGGVEVSLPEEELKERGDPDDVEENNNKVWENMVAGLAPDGTVGTGARQNDDEESITVIADNLVIPPADTGVDVVYHLDEVLPDGARGPEESHSASPGGLKVDLRKVESNKYYRVRIVISQIESGYEKEIVATNVLGVLKVPTAPVRTIVSVPWGQLGDGDAEIKVEELVKTANLTPDDRLFVYRPDSGNYDVWSLGGDYTWTPVNRITVGLSGTVETPGQSASDATVPRGSACWLERQDTTKPFYLYGQVETNLTATSTLDPAKDGKSSWNIVGSPSVNALDLNAKFTNPSEGDRIILPTGGAPKNYSFKGGKWGYYDAEPVMKDDVQIGVRSVFKSDDATIPPGLGFWYISNSETSRTVVW